MRKPALAVIAAFGGWLTLQPVTLLADTQYAIKSGVEVTQEPSPTAKVMTTLDKDAPVQVAGGKERYVQVQLPNGTRGWVYQFKLTKNAPRAAGGNINLAALSGGNTVHAKEARTGGSIRGMQPVAAGYASKRRIDPSHVKSLEWMEWFQLSDKELLNFKREGRIGEFFGAK